MMASAPDVHLVLEQDADLKIPRMYSVLLLNDDYTTMDFVVRVLTSFFDHSPEKAEALMLLIHTQGQAVCGHYPYDIALSKIERVHSLAKMEEFPLRCRLEVD